MQGLSNWNAVRYDSQQPSAHVESYFLKAHDPKTPRALWLRASIIAPCVRPAHAIAEAWAIVCEQDGSLTVVKESLPVADTRFSKEELLVSIGSFFHLDAETCHGAIQRTDHQIRWDLHHASTAKAWVHSPLPAAIEHAVSASHFASPFPDLRIDGSLSVDGRTIDVSGWQGMQGHHWGRAHPPFMAWGHCNQWEQQVDTVVEAVSIRERLGPILGPLWTLVSVRHAGTEHSFCLPHHGTRTRGELHNRRWFIGAKHGNLRIEADFSAQTDDFAGMYYPNPDGSMTYRLHTMTGFGRVHLDLPGQRPMDLTTRGACFEIGTSKADHGVRMYV